MIVFRHKSDAYYFTAGALLVLWGIIGVLVMGLGGMRLWQNHQRMAAVVAFKAHEQALIEEFEECNRTLQQFLHSKPFLLNFTHNDLEAALNKGQPFTVTFDAKGDAAVIEAMGADLTARWTGPSGEQDDIKFNFRNGQLVSYFGSNPHWRDIITSLPPSRLDKATLIFGWWVSMSWKIVIVWGALFIVALFWRRGRPVVVQPMLMISVVAVVLALVTPDGFAYLLGQSELIRLHRPGRAEGMLCVSLIAALWTLAAGRESALPLCDTCGYLLIGNSSGVCPECGTQIKVRLSH